MAPNKRRKVKDGHNLMSDITNDMLVGDMDHNKRRKVLGGRNPLSDITNVSKLTGSTAASGQIELRKLTPVGPGRYVLNQSLRRTNGKENCSTNNENNAAHIKCFENGADTEVPDNSHEVREDQSYLADVQGFQSECNENGEASDVPDNDSDVELHAPILVSNELNFYENQDFEAECNQNYEGEEIPFNDYDGADYMGEMDDSNDTDYFNIGEPRFICEWCGAVMWYEERVSKHRDTSNPEFSLCCMQGRIEIVPFKRLPRQLYDLYHKNDKKSKYFLENIRSFNSMFAFTSMGATIDKTRNNGKAPPVFVLNGENYHHIGSLLPKHGDQPRFAQLYIYDTDNELRSRMASVRMEDDKNSLKRDIVKEIRHILDHSNSFVKSYRMVRDKLIQDNAPNISLRILGKRSYDGRRYNLPATSEVAALVVGDYDAADFERDMVVQERSGLLKRISVFETSYLPLQYPLIFFKRQGWFSKRHQV